MYPTLLMAHSLVRYFVIVFMILVLFRSFYGWIMQKPFGKPDSILSRLLVSGTHLQLLLGVILFFLSPLVTFSSDTMKDSVLRYWTVEHWILMLIAVLLITVSSFRIKKLTVDVKKHRAVFLLNGIAMLIILISLTMSGRGIL
jgi:hypothetical protein